MKKFLERQSTNEVYNHYGVTRLSLRLRTVFSEDKNYSVKTL